jgi:hypothetical protein
MRPIGASPIATAGTESSIDRMLDSVNLGSVLNSTDSFDGEMRDRKKGRAQLIDLYTKTPKKGMPIPQGTDNLF